MESQVTGWGKLPMFALGHSMGGLTTLLAVMDNPSLFDGCVLSAPFLDSPVDQRVPDLVASFLIGAAGLFPKAYLFRLDSRVSSDKAVLAAHANDPLMYVQRSPIYWCRRPAPPSWLTGATVTCSWTQQVHRPSSSRNRRSNRAGLAARPHPAA